MTCMLKKHMGSGLRWWCTLHRLDPLDLGIKRCEVKDLAGGDAALNASILEDVFGGAQNAVADALNLNAGVALAACEVAGSPEEGVAMAQVSTARVSALPRCKAPLVTAGAGMQCCVSLCALCAS